MIVRGPIKEVAASCLELHLHFSSPDCQFTKAQRRRPHTERLRERLREISMKFESESSLSVYQSIEAASIRETERERERVKERT